MTSIHDDPLASRGLPQRFLDRLEQLEALYLLKGDPILRSGFGGGPERWRKEREPILDAITGDGSLLDVGCANGYLAESLANWGRERGLQLTPHGIDAGRHLINEARARMPEFKDNFHVGNAWDWQPRRRYSYVYMLWDCLPPYYLGRGLHRLRSEFVAPGGRLIVGTYGSRSRGQKPWDMERYLASIDMPIAGRSAGGEPRITSFFWIDA
ncbi:MAG: class I SAM-dependent methyltransferase [Planctomycetes bacterium]|nr:class I SAM-dependent methyltransferase [Planctomycetota bacterium]